METASQEPRMGGGPLSIMAFGGSDLIDSLLPVSEGGTKLAAGLKDRIQNAYGIEVHLGVPQKAGGGSAEALQAVRAVPTVAAEDPDGSAVGVGLEGSPDVILLSLDPKHDGDVEAFGHNMRDIVGFAKNDLHAHVVVFNASTVDHDDLTSNYTGVDETLALRIHRLNLALMWLSLEQGISIVDVDRLIADIGAGAHVRAVQDYSAEASGLICDELIRVIADYGFFEQRPLVAQLGRAAGR